uniref:ZP domain-containing protein n=1 Tax=Haemonchus contortus TaxID=6289 RepID=A0A7I4XSZ6_HAECO
VSLYKPESAEAGHRPTLLISNAAKGDAARLGYIPPPPNQFLSLDLCHPNTTTHDRIQDIAQETPTTEQTTTTPFHIEVPTKGPHVFMPPQNFPAPSPSSQIPRVPAYEMTFLRQPVPWLFNRRECKPDGFNWSNPMCPTRVRGKVHVICKEDGIEFSATTLFPFTGQIFANERKRVSSCVYNLVDSVRPMVFLPFADCGVKNAGDQKDNRAQYHMQVVMVIQQNDGTSTVSVIHGASVHQKIHYNKQTLPRRIEEALEELRLVATKLGTGKPPLPQVEMKIVVDEHHQIGPEWKLIPESDAYGFHVKNCIVRDDISGIEHKMIDELGCSTDLSIFPIHIMIPTMIRHHHIFGLSRCRIILAFESRHSVRESDHFAYKFNSFTMQKVHS